MALKIQGETIRGFLLIYSFYKTMSGGVAAS